MELGFYLPGTLTDGSIPAGWLRRSQEWLHESWADTLLNSEIAEDERGAPMLRFQLHPGAPDAVITAHEHSLVSFAAETGWAGPGYHHHVYSLLREMANALAVSWNPSGANGGSHLRTGHFFSADRGALERMAQASLGEVAQAALTEWETNRRPTTFSLPATHEFEFDGPIATPLGPRDQAWLRAVARDPTRGTDVFPWWEPGQDAKYRLGRALSEIWTSVRWRKPVTDEETAQLCRILGLLDAAHAESPDLPYPWREWEELAAYLGTARAVPPHPEPAGSAMAGYRRRDVRVKLAGRWSISLPGTFAENWEGDGTFCAWDGRRTLWFSAQDTPERGSLAPADELLPELEPGERGVDLPELPAGFARRAGVGDLSEGGETLRKLNVRLALPGRLVLFTVTYDDPNDEAWAIRTIESVRHPEVAAP